MKQLLIVVLKGCSYVGASLCRLHVPSVLGGRAGFDVDASHVFPQGVLAAITLVGCVAGIGVARACSGYEEGVPLCSVAVTALSRLGAAQVAGADTLRVRLELALFLLSVCFSFSPHWGLCPKVGGML